MPKTVLKCDTLNKKKIEICMTRGSSQYPREVHNTCTSGNSATRDILNGNVGLLIQTLTLHFFRVTFEKVYHIC